VSYFVVAFSAATPTISEEKWSTVSSAGSHVIILN